jgi:hypothetical protein
MITRGVIALTLLAAVAGCSSHGTMRPVTIPSQSGPSQSSSAASPSGGSTPTAPSSSPTSTPPALPAAKDGQNYKACNDGNCEVLIRKKAALNLHGDKFTATVASGTLKLTDSKGYISLSKNGSDSSRSGNGSVGGGAGGVSWNDGDGPVHVATLTYAEGDVVIVSFMTK